MSERIKNIPYWVYDILSVVSSIITIITAIVTSFNAIVHIRELEDGTYQVSVNPVLIGICVMLLMLIIVCFVKLRKYGIVIRNIKKSYPENYYNFLREFRNAYFEILKGYKENKMADSNSRIGILTKDTKMFLESALDNLCELMEKNTGRKICASIKLIENMGIDTNIDKNTATIVTFCRSKNSDSDRTANDNKEQAGVLIKNNTDFYEMLDDNTNNSNVFYQSDLMQYDLDLKKVNKAYHNTTNNWSKYYKGTIVVPIRVARRRLHYLSLDEGYDIIGFLCVDSLATDAFRNNVDKNNNIRIVKSFAAELYIILNKYRFYLTKISNGGTV